MYAHAIIYIALRFDQATLGRSVHPSPFTSPSSGSFTPLSLSHCPTASPSHPGPIFDALITVYVLKPNKVVRSAGDWDVDTMD